MSLTNENIVLGFQGIDIFLIDANKYKVSGLDKVNLHSHHTWKANRGWKTEPLFFQNHLESPDTALSIIPISTGQCYSILSH